MVDATITPSDGTLTLDQLVDRIDEISSLPDVAVRILKVVNLAESTVADLRSVVESDPALVARVLRTVNSAAYGLRTKVDSIHRGIALLGFNAIKNLSVTASVAQIFKDQSPIGTYTRPGLWKHLVSVGVAARMIASRCGLEEFDEAYMCGLLHDFGLIILDQHHHDAFVEVVTSVSAQTPTLEIEEKIYGYNHAKVGAAIAEKWGFPGSVVNAIRHHHKSSDADEQNRQLVRTVEVANFLCSKKEITSLGVHNIQTPTADVFAGLSLGRTDLKVIWDDLDQELEKAAELFEM